MQAQCEITLVELGEGEVKYETPSATQTHKTACSR
jgi:hypothetical protein